MIVHSLKLSSKSYRGSIQRLTRVTKTVFSFSTVSNPYETLHNPALGLLKLLKKIPEKIELLKPSLDDEAKIEATTQGVENFLNQIESEKNQLREAKLSYASVVNDLIKMGKGTGFRKTREVMLGWYDGIIKEIDNRIHICTVNNKQPDTMCDLSIYGPCLMVLPPEKYAVILLDVTLNFTLKYENRPIRVVNLALALGDAVESEFLSLKGAMKAKKGEDGISKWKKDLLVQVMSKNRSRRTLGMKLMKLVDEEQWSSTLKVKVGSALLGILVESARMDTGEGAFTHKLIYDPARKVKVGHIEMNVNVYQSIVPKDYMAFAPRFLPMLIPPKNWNNKKNAGCYWFLKSNLMRTESSVQNLALRQANIGDILCSLDYLGRVPWRINEKVLDIVNAAWARQMMIGSLPQVKDNPMPAFKSCLRIPLPTSVPGTEFDSNKFYEKVHYKMCEKVSKINSELHSLRCNTKLQIGIADKFKGKKIYYPYNLDFRGRAYPLPPNLNHVQSDLCRGLLLFDEAKPLGKHGMKWLKVHLANLFGFNKMPHDKRVEFVNENMDKVLESVRRPLDGDMWWASADDPFQALSTCFEIVAASESPVVEEYMCRLPVHQDGSCNGLQHYAALGKDELGAAAVNLTPSVEPQDVYSKVLDIVLAKIEVDCERQLDETEPAEVLEINRTNQKAARLVKNIVNRKVIKQTVMTSVYGVTFIGARDQIMSKLEGKLVSGATPEATEIDLRLCSRYVAKLTLDSLREMFSSAKEIMDWLSECAAKLSDNAQPVTWISPLGLPIVQPYKKERSFTVVTAFQNLNLAVEYDDLPVQKRKQRTALPPNFVHSLDATHMLITCKKMMEKKLVFASVHDSYWTHPCDVDEMNEALREAFVELYEQPLLENFRNSLVRRYPQISFPKVPTRGNLDLKLVKKSTYFFH